MPLRERRSQKDQNSDSSKHVTWSTDLLEIHEFSESSKCMLDDPPSKVLSPVPILKRRKSDDSNCSTDLDSSSSNSDNEFHSKEPIHSKKKFQGLKMKKSLSFDDEEKPTSEYSYPNKRYLVELLEAKKQRKIIDQLA